jgi:hypothetical protein
LDGLAHPHSRNPYAQIVFNMHLYIKVLFFRESLDFRPKSHDICRTLKLSCWRFVLMCLCQVSATTFYPQKLALMRRSHGRYNSHAGSDQGVLYFIDHFGYFYNSELIFGRSLNNLLNRMKLKLAIQRRVYYVGKLFSELW